ncbi:hypothetical protein OXX69_005504, partial [Metschnikowia pulcherrima]
MYDSGAQQSLVCELELLTEYKECHQTFEGIDGIECIATHVGKLTLEGQGRTITLDGVLFSPDVEYNLVSTWHIAAAGYTVCHDTESLWLTEDITGEKFIIAHSPGDYLFWGSSKLKPLVSEKNATSAELMTSDKAWKGINAHQFYLISNIKLTDIPNPFGTKSLLYYHLVCGHASLEALNALKKLKILSFEEQPGERELLRECRTCNEANMTAKPHNKKYNPATRKHGRVHSDTMGPILGENGRAIYITTLIDEFTRYLEIIITESKAFKQKLLNRLRVWNSRFPDEKIRFFRSDNATEMPTAEELEELGIEKEPISSYSPQQNGLAEAMNRVLINKVTKIITPFAEYNYLPFMKYILDHAAYLTNHLPPRNRDTIPQIAYHGVEVDSKSYMTFGVDVIVKMSGTQEAKGAGATYHKFSKTAKGIYLGHNGNAGYKILANSRTLLKTKDVTFLRSMDNIVEYFNMADKMGYERVHPEKNAVDQLNQSLGVNRFMLEHPPNQVQQESSEEPEIDAIEAAPLTEAVERSYQSGHAVVTSQPNVITTMEVPDEKPEKYSSIILPIDESADQREQTGPHD